MSIAVESRRGRAALMVAHCAGMVDLVALPVWVGTLISRYGFDPQQAGGLATLFLLGVVIASSVVAPRIHRLPGRTVSSVGFCVSALGFWLASQTNTYAELGVVHAVCGLSTGAALSVTHGTIARSSHPHRLFAMAGTALGIFAVAFLVSTPQFIAAWGAVALFRAFAVVMGVAGVVALLAFPAQSDKLRDAPQAQPTALPVAAWFGIGGISCMALVQAMTFSYLEQVGVDRGFERQSINGVLVALGLVNLTPAVLAGLLERHWNPRRVLLVGPMVQACVASTIMLSTAFGLYAAAASAFAAVMIFTHTFAFGLLARLDRSGRVLAATPAMLMLGSAIGPILGGTLVKAAGYGSLAVAAVVMAAAATWCFSRLPVASNSHQLQEAMP